MFKHFNNERVLNVIETFCESGKLETKSGHSWNLTTPSANEI